MGYIIQAKYKSYIDVTDEVNAGQDISDLIDENEPTLCYTCSKLISSDVDGNVHTTENEDVQVGYQVFTLLEESDESISPDELTAKLAAHQADVAESLELCHACGEKHYFEFKEVIHMTKEGE